MKKIEGNIVNIIDRKIVKGRVYYSNKIEKVEEDSSVESNNYILPGFVDAHVHIESSMLTPLEYSKVAVKHGVVAAVTDPHEIANVCGKQGVQFMIDSAEKTPMKIYFGAPSCVPATSFETSGAQLGFSDIDELFSSNKCSHLAEMMNFPGVIYDDNEVIQKMEVAKNYNRVIDGHAPLLSGKDLRKYVDAGVSTDHECSTIDEALEKISLGMKILIREGSAAKDFNNLKTLIKTYPEMTMLCTDDCHPDELKSVYINGLVQRALNDGYSLFDVLQTATKNAVDHYKLDIGLLEVGDSADFIEVDNFEDFNILTTCIGGEKVFDVNGVLIFGKNDSLINNFYKNGISAKDLVVKRVGESIKVIDLVSDSLLTNKFDLKLSCQTETVSSDIEKDILKIVVLNRYKKAKPSVAFIRGFNLKRGAIAGSIAHDSHNIVAVGVNDLDIVAAINEVQYNKGALVVVDGGNVSCLPLPVAGLMSDKDVDYASSKYKELSDIAIGLGCTLKAPFMTLAFMSLLVIPELKIGDKGLFDVTKFDFVPLQNS